MRGYPPFKGRVELRERPRALPRRLRRRADPDHEVAVVPRTKTAIMLAAGLRGRRPAVTLPDPATRTTSPPSPWRARRWRCCRRRRGGGPTSTRWAAAPGARGPRHRPTCAACEAPGPSSRGGVGTSAGLAANDLPTPPGLRRRRAQRLEVDGARDGPSSCGRPKVCSFGRLARGFAVGNAELVERIRLLLDHLATRVPWRCSSASWLR